MSMPRLVAMLFVGVSIIAIITAVYTLHLHAKQVSMSPGTLQEEPFAEKLFHTLVGGAWSSEDRPKKEPVVVHGVAYV